MSNTYFKIEKSVETKGFDTFPSYTNNYELTLTALMGGENHTQLTVQTTSTIVGQSGIGYIVLSDNDVDNLIAGLLERKLRKITATGEEKSSFKPIEDE